MSGITYRNIKGTEITAEEYDASLKWIEDALKVSTPIKTEADAWPIAGTMSVRAYATNYPILVTFFTALPKTLTPQTLNESTGDANYSANNPTHIRTDAVVADVQEDISIIQGIPGVDPDKPSVPAETHYLIRYITVTAAGTIVDTDTGTEETNIQTIYKEFGTEAGGEADATPSAASILINSTNTPLTDTKSIETVNPQKMDRIWFDYSTLQNTNSATHLNFKTKLKSALGFCYFFLGFYKNGVRIKSGTVAWYLFTDGQHGFDKSNITDKQYISVPLVAAQFDSIEYDRIELWIYHDKTTIPGYWIDDVEFVNAFTTNPNLPTTATPQIQVDWDQEDTTAVDFIKNKERLQNLEIKIDGYFVDKKANTNILAIEIGDQIRGNFSVSRYIIADVTALPHTNENNLEIYLDIEK